MSATCSAASKKWCRRSLSKADYRRIYSAYDKHLAPFSTTLVSEFRRSAEAAEQLLTPDEVKQWAEEGLELARQAWRSWEAAGEDFRVTPEGLPALGFRQFRRWAQHGPGLG